MLKYSFDEIDSDVITDLLSSNSKLLVIFVLLSDDDPNNPSWEYATTIYSSGSAFSYTLEGHGIGSNEYVLKNIDEVVERLKFDSDRFNNRFGIFVAV